LESRSAATLKPRKTGRETDLAERRRLKEYVSFDPQAAHLHFFELSQREVTPLGLEADHITIEQKVLGLGFAFHYKPGPPGSRKEELGKHGWIGGALLFAQFGKSVSKLFGKKPGHE